MSRRRSLPALVAVLLHIAFIAALQPALGPSPPHAADKGPPAIVWLRDTPRAAARAGQPPPALTTPPRATAVPRMPVQRPRTAAPGEDAQPIAAIEAPDAAQREAEPASAAAPAPPASAARERLLDTDATRQAIRRFAQQPLLSERAAGAGRPSVDERLGHAVQQAGRGDCAKGEYFGAGAGLLSAPFLAAAYAAGKCAK